MASVGGLNPPAAEDASTGSGQAQAIVIVGAPHLAEEPAFGALVVCIPLNEEPSAAWLQHFRANQLPGHAHRADDDGLVFHLDRNDQDVSKAMRDIAAAITKTNDSAMSAADEDRKAQIKWDSAMKSKREKIDKRLAEWWEQERRRGDGLPANP